MKKVITVVGARPQFIKASVVSHALRQQPNLQEIFVHTGQHYDINMSQIFFDELDISKIHHQLETTGTTHAKQTSEMMIGIEAILLQEKPQWVLIYGDTNSTLAAALAAAKLHIPIAHVEAGLRSFNRHMPEEVNRLVADQLAAVLFAPTKEAVNNLLQEGYAQDRIIEVGDVMYDAALHYAEKATVINTSLHSHPEYILATIHRAENTDNPDKLVAIFTALEELSKTIPVILPLHPRTRKLIDNDHPTLLKNTTLTLIDPVGFLDMIRLEKNAKLIMTDSGGIQKEAFFYQVPCVTLRSETEWVETITLGWNRLASPLQASEIVTAAYAAIASKGELHHYPYGKGNAAQQIAQYLTTAPH